MSAIRRTNMPSINAHDAPTAPEASWSWTTATQIHYTHGVPKTRAAIGERISLAFRVKPDQQPPKANGDSGVDR